MDRKKLIRIAAAALSVAALVATMVGPASAGAGFNCNDCIDKGDLGGSSVGSSEIVNHSIGNVELAPSASRRLGMRSFDQLSTDGTTDPQTLQAFTVTIPGPGTLLLHTTGNSYVERDAGADVEINTEVILALCRVADSVSDNTCGDADTAVQYMYYADYDNENGDNTTNFVSFWRKFTFSNGGQKTFYINADVTGTFTFDLGDCCGGANVAAFYSPTTLPIAAVA